MAGKAARVKARRKGKVIRIPLRDRTGGVVAHALVDDDDYERLNLGRWRWCRNSKGYVMRTTHVGGRAMNFRLHRVVMDAPDGIEVDHRNGNKLDNRRSNLRLATSALNSQNQLLSHANTSGYRGVTRERGRWKAKSVLDGRTHHIGYYATAEEAGRAAASWRAAHMPFSVEASLPMKSDRLPLEEVLTT